MIGLYVPDGLPVPPTVDRSEVGALVRDGALLAVSDASENVSLPSARRSAVAVSIDTHRRCHIVRGAPDAAHGEAAGIVASLDLLTRAPDDVRRILISDQTYLDSARFWIILAQRMDKCGDGERRMLGEVIWRAQNGALDNTVLVCASSHFGPHDTARHAMQAADLLAKRVRKDTPMTVAGAVRRITRSAQREADTIISASD